MCLTGCQQSRRRRTRPPQGSTPDRLRRRPAVGAGRPAGRHIRAAPGHRRPAPRRDDRPRALIQASARKPSRVAPGRARPGRLPRPIARRGPPPGSAPSDLPFAQARRRRPGPPPGSAASGLFSGTPTIRQRVTPGRGYPTRYKSSSGRGRSRRGRTAVASPPPRIFSSSRRPAWPEWWPPRRPRDDTSGHSRVSRILTGTSGRLAGDRSSPLGGWGLGFGFPSSRCFAPCCRCARRRRGRQGTGRATAIQRAIRAIRERAVRRGGRQR